MGSFSLPLYLPLHLPGFILGLEGSWLITPLNDRRVPRRSSRATAPPWCAPSGFKSWPCHRLPCWLFRGCDTVCASPQCPDWDAGGAGRGLIAVVGVRWRTGWWLAPYGHPCAPMWFARVPQTPCSKEGSAMGGENQIALKVVVGGSTPWGGSDGAGRYLGLPIPAPHSPLPEPHPFP